MPGALINVLYAPYHLIYGIFLSIYYTGSPHAIMRTFLGLCNLPKVTKL